MSGGYFEGQKSKDCVIHSFNNAFGRSVITKDEVLEYIDSKVSKEVRGIKNTHPEMSDAEIAKIEKQARSKYATNNTFFTADIVWECAKKKGVYKVHIPIPGFVSPFLRMDAMTPDVLSHPIVLLGGDRRGGTHAIAVRDGMIYDSEMVREGPRPLVKKEVKRLLPQVFGAYVFLSNSRDATVIRRSLNIVGE